VLGIAGAKVTQANSVHEASEIFAKIRPDLVISDIAMPERDGYDLIRHLRQLPPARGGKVPAIAMTAYAREEDRARALAAGFQVHVAKPIEPADILSAAARLVESPNGRAASALVE
jgi:CheY-like chemotaxis protein